MSPREREMVVEMEHPEAGTVYGLGIPVKLVNLNKPSKAELENIFKDYHIDMLTAMQGRKNLLYNLVA